MWIIFEFKRTTTLNLFDVVLCIDAAYHSDLNSFLNSTSFGFEFKRSNCISLFDVVRCLARVFKFKKQQYRYLLKSADVNWQNLMGEQQLTQKLIQKGFTQIEIQDFSEPVLNGFAVYIENKRKQRKHFDLAQLKIDMTAKLCRNSIKMV